MSAWAKKWKMSINTDKTKTLILSTSSADTSWNPQLILDNEPIKTTKEYSFLGVAIENSLRFTKHLENTVK